MKLLYFLLRVRHSVKCALIGLLVVGSLVPALSQTTVIFTTSGTFTVPPGVATLTVECWGAGGAGGGNNGPSQGGGGGGGGAYSRADVAVAPLAGYPVTVGTGFIGNNSNGLPGGSSSFSSTVLAAGGQGGFSAQNGNAPGAGGLAGTGIGTFKSSGGSGGSGNTSGGAGAAGGGGGSSAGSVLNGTMGQNASGGIAGLGGIAPLGGGDGGTGGFISSNPAPGFSGVAPGGGGGGSGSGPAFGGSGANGQVKITYTDPGPPYVSPDVMTLNLNGASPETIVFTMSKELNLSEGASVTGFSVSSGSIASAIYSGKGITNTITLTSFINGSWSSSTTVSYSAGNVADLTLQSMASIVAHAVVQGPTSLSAGDIAFTGYNSGTSLDEFSFVLLKDISSGTVIKFTDNGWNGSALQIAETTITWTAAFYIQAGTAVKIINTSPSGPLATFINNFAGAATVSSSGSIFTLDTGGDNILAYQGSSSSPTFIAGILNSIDGGTDASQWNSPGIVGTDPNRSALPPGLINAVNALSLNVCGRFDDNVKLGVAVLTGSAQQLRTAINTCTNWNFNCCSSTFVLVTGTNVFPIIPVITAVTIPATTMIVNSVVLATITVHDDRESQHALISGTIAGFTLFNLNRVNSTFYIAQFVVTEGGTDVLPASSIPISNLILTSSQGNAMSTAYTTPITQAGDLIDANSPYVVSINRNIIATTTTAYSGNTGTIATIVVFRITFSENMQSGTLTAADFSYPTTGLTGSPSASLITPITGTSVFDITVTGYTGTGTIGLNYVDSEVGTGLSVLDLIGNPTKSAALAADGSFTGQTFSIVLPEPTNHVTIINALPVTDNYSVMLTWTNPTGGNPATAYAIRAKGPNTADVIPGAFTPVADGAPLTLTNDTDFSDGLGIVYGVSTAATSYTFTTLLSGKTYDFEIIPYALSANNSADNINYNTTSIPTRQGTPSVVSQGSITAGVTTAPSTLSSLQTTFPAGANYSFKVRDDGLDLTVLTGDNARTKYNVIRIYAGGGNTVTNWIDVIGSAQLNATTETVTPIPHTTIGANFIDFTLPTTDDAAGELDDNEEKNYELRIALKGSMTGGANLTADGQSFDFLVDYSSFTYANTTTVQSSTIRGIAPIQSFSSGASNTIGVVADRLAVATQPATTALVLTNLTTSPVIRATDGNGNLDRHYTTALAITNATSLPMSQTTLAAAGAFPNGGVYTFPVSFQYTDDGSGAANNGNLILTDNTLGFDIDITTGNVTVTYTSTTTITDGALTEPDFIPSTTTTLLGALDVFDFNINEDNLIAAGTDGSPTRITQIVIAQGSSGNEISTWTDVIQGAELIAFGSDGTQTVAGTVASSSITFGSGGTLTTTSGGAGYVKDNETKTYRLRIYLKPSTVSPSTIDMQNLVFRMIDTNALVDLTSQSSRIAASDRNSGTAKNEIEVHATEFRFITEPNADLLVNKDINLQQTVPQLQATDINGNRDLEYGRSVTVTNAGTLPMTNAPTTFGTGLLTFSNSFQFDQIGNGTITVTQSGGPFPAPTVVTPKTSSTTSIVRVGVSGTITAGAAAPATISSLTNNPLLGAVAAFNFVINDDPGGTPSGQDDGNPTLISQIVITQKSSFNTIPDWSLAIIAGAYLTDGTNSTTVSSINPTNITFSGINTGTLGLIADNTSKTYTLKIALKSTLGGTLPATIDGLAFGFEILTTGITTVAGGTSVMASQSQNSGAANVITVVATQLDYTTPPPGITSFNTSFPSPVVIEARDVNANRDLGFVSSITVFSNTGALGMVNAPVVGNLFSVGTFTFNAGFQYTTAGTGTLTVTAGGLTGVSPTVIVRSQQADIVFSSGVASTFSYVNFQAASGLTTAAPPNASASAGLATFQIRDGGGSIDADNQNTVLSGLTLDLGNNYSYFRKVAIFDASTNVAEMDVTGEFVSFTGLTYSVPDDGNRTFTIRATFSTTVVDKDNFQVSVSSATAASNGSAFAAFSPANSNVHTIAVIADRLYFAFPPATALVNQNFGVTVRAVDVNNNKDDDNTASVTLSKFSGAGVLTSTDAGSLIKSLSLGSVSWTQLQYSVVETFTIRAAAGGLTSADLSLNVLAPAGEPANQATAINFSSIGLAAVTVNFTNGNGNSRILVAKSGSSVDSNPVDGIGYSVNTVYGSGAQLGTGNYVVGSGAGPITVTGLAAGTTYFFRVYEFNVGVAGTENYNISTASGNPASVSTLSMPTITSFNPVSGGVGVTVIITGTNFDPAFANNTVKFNGTTATNTAGTATSITCAVPVGATSGAITVTVNGLTATSSTNFTFIPPPAISSFNPTSGPVGSSVTITGTNFDTTPANNTVKFNGTAATVTASTATSITTSVPLGATDGAITVTVGGQTATSSTNFTVTIVPAPTISSFNPTSGSIGTLVTITGTNFDTTPANNTVKFNGTSAVVSASTAISITTSVPTGATDGAITVTVGGQTATSATNFTVSTTPAPTITSFNPTSGPIGTTVTITGTNFDTAPANNSVKFNGTNAIATASTATTITTSVPSGTTTGTISVTVGGQTTTSSNSFTITVSPTVTSFTPSSGTIGTTVTITGTNFDLTAINNTVKFNGTTATVISSSATTITTTVPTGANTGKITVMVGGVSGQSLTDFVVDTSVPIITNSTTGSGLTLSATITDTETGVASASVEYRSIALGGAFVSAALTATGNLWSVTLPAVVTLSDLGIEYRFKATNGAGMTSPNTQLFTIQVPTTAVPALTAIPFTGFGTTTEAYRIFSIPLELTSPTLGEVLNELGGVDKKKWRAARYENGAVSYLTTSSVISPGKGYWLLIKDNVTLDAGAGKTVNASSENPFVIPLVDGWNQIGNPYSFDVPWAEVQSANPGIPELKVFSGTYAIGPTLEKYKGGFVKVVGNVALKIPVIKKNGRGTSIDYVKRNPIDENDWQVLLSVRQGSYQYNLGGVGMNPQASPGFDVFDDFTLPRMSDYLELNHNRKQGLDFYSRNIVPSEENHQWEFSIDSNLPDESVYMSWDNSYFGDGDKVLVLEDLKRNVLVNMSERSSYSFPFTKDNRFRILYGSLDYVLKESLSETARILSVSPNPSDGKFTVEYAIPAGTDQHVSISILDLMGKTVGTIVSKNHAGGFYKASWEVTGDARLSSAIYLIQLKTSSKITYQRIIIK